MFNDDCWSGQVTADATGAEVVWLDWYPNGNGKLSKVEAITQGDLDDIQRKARVKVT